MKELNTDNIIEFESFLLRLEDDKFQDSILKFLRDELDEYYINDSKLISNSENISLILNNFKNIDLLNRLAIFFNSILKKRLLGKYSDVRLIDIIIGYFTKHEHDLDYLNLTKFILAVNKSDLSQQVINLANIVFTKKNPNLDQDIIIKIVFTKCDFIIIQLIRFIGLSQSNLLLNVLNNASHLEINEIIRNNLITSFYYELKWVSKKLGINEVIQLKKFYKDLDHPYKEIFSSVVCLKEFNILKSQISYVDEELMDELNKYELIASYICQDIYSKNKYESCIYDKYLVNSNVMTHIIDNIIPTLESQSFKNNYYYKGNISKFLNYCFNKLKLGLIINEYLYKNFGYSYDIKQRFLEHTNDQFGISLISKDIVEKEVKDILPGFSQSAIYQGLEKIVERISNESNSYAI